MPRFRNLLRQWKRRSLPFMITSALSFIAGVIISQIQFAFSQVDPVEAIKTGATDINLYIALIIGLITVVGSISTFGMWLKRSINKENLERLKAMDVKIDLTSVNLSNQITAVNNNVVAQSNNSKEVLTDIKSKIDRFEVHKETTIKHDTILHEHDRRITELERR